MVLKNTVSEFARLDSVDRQIIAAIQDGLPLAKRPYQIIAEQLGLSEQAIIQRIKKLQHAGTIKRMGVVVRHHELGFRANAMVVWNIADDKVEGIARKIASFDCVTLCYQRPRRLPDWPYNLFSMIHGKDRESVLHCLEDIVETLELQHIPHEPLFSTRRFKQRGGRFIRNEDIRHNTGRQVLQEPDVLPQQMMPLYG